MAEVLRTDDVTQADRFAQWRHWISAMFVPLECAPVTRELFRGEAAHWELGELLVPGWPPIPTWPRGPAG